MKYSLRVAWFCGVLMLGGMLEPLAYSASQRTSHPWGMYLSGNGEPATHTLGLNLAWQPLDFVRFSGGVGYLGNDLGNIPRAFENYFFGPIAYSVVTVLAAVTFPFVWTFKGFTTFASTGHVRTHLQWDQYRPQYADYQVGYLRPRSVFSYGGAAKFFVPGWSFTPAGGVGWSHVSSTGTPNLPRNAGFVYYATGLDYTASNGLNLAAGINWCPSLRSGSCGFYGSIGKFF